MEVYRRQESRKSEGRASEREGGHSEGLPGNRHWVLISMETMPKESMLTQDKNMEAGDMSPMFQAHVPGNTVSLKTPRRTT